LREEKRWERKGENRDGGVDEDNRVLFPLFWYLEGGEGNLLPLFKLAYKVFTTGSLFGSNPLVFLCRKPEASWLRVLGLSLTYKYQDKVREADEMYQRAFDVHRAFGENDVGYLDALSGIDEICSLRGDLDEGEIMYEEVLAGLEPGKNLSNIR
jgi:hypothetical protein